MIKQLSANIKISVNIAVKGLIPYNIIFTINLPVSVC